MQSSLIGKVEKARLYAQEPERVTFSAMTVNFRGDNDSHTTSLNNHKWHCSCGFFANWGLCCHTMAMEKILCQMLPLEARTNFEAAEKA
jgi:hypothetical protein